MEPSDAAVEAGANELYERLFHLGITMTEAESAACAALEAAYRVDVPKPLLDRNAVSRDLTEVVDRSMETGALPLSELVDAMMELARPMPTREQIAEAVYLSESAANAHRPAWSAAAPGVRALFYDIADSVLALLNGAES
jgi:hypothetical protein